jgi:pyridoxal 5'-phosphate synthase pdxT subunit
MSGRVGVLALQGDVPEHAAALSAHVPADRVVPVRTPDDLAGVDALLMPGGESTTIGRLLGFTRLGPEIVARARKGLPILATCAGLILISRELEPSPFGRDPTPLGLLDVKVRRNDYGAQRESFEGPVRMPELPGRPFPGVFIRSPRIVEVGGEVRPIAFLGEQVVGVRQGPIWGLTFHPELSGDPRLLSLFLQKSPLGRTAAPLRTPRAGRTGHRR